MLRRLFFLSFALTLFALGAPAQAGAPSCAAVFRAASDSLTEVRNQLDLDLKDPAQSLKSLPLAGSEITVLRPLGHGLTAAVYEVRWRNKNYALKVFDYAHSSSKLARRMIEETIVIHKHLGELGLAPKVMGVSYDLKILSHLKSKSLGNFGYLMELTSNDNLKSVRYTERIQVSLETRKNLLAQAAEFEKILKFLGIDPLDMDAVVTKEGHLQLIDLSMYLRRPFDSAGDLRTYIEDGTEVVEE